ncbi:MAG TPA: pyruvate formate lyase family protein [Spirochaetia bacterium]|nr:pyruvate formate lyase family protein [Spirochaetia bacterium]
MNKSPGVSHDKRTASDRITRLKESIFNVSEICPERARLVTESYMETEGLPQVIRVARAFERVLRELTIHISGDELLIGNLTRKPAATTIYPEFGVRFVEEEMDSFATRPYDRFVVPEKAKRDLKKAIGYWKGKTREEKVVELASTVLPQMAGEAWDPKSFGIKPVIYAGYRKASGGSSHTALNTEKLLKGGFRAIRKEADEALSRVDFSSRDAIKRHHFLQSVLICFDAVSQYLGRCAAKAEETAQTEKSETRKDELEQLAGVCRRISSDAPRTFWEALQLIWSVHLFRWVESNGHSVTIGRLDQLLFPFYTRDLEEDILTREKARELLSHFFIKVGQIKKIRPWSETVYKGGSPTFQGITIGGQRSDGSDATNALSSLILEVTGSLKIPEPVVMCRIHQGSPVSFLIEGIEALVQHGGGLPSFFSDEAVIPALQREGIPLGEAREYAMVSCSEPAVPGKHVDHTGASVYINLTKVLELSLNGGKDPATGLSLFPSEKSLTSFASFEDLWQSFKEQLESYMHFVPVLTSITSSLDPELNPTPFASALLDYRIEMGADMTEGGGPNDNNTIVQGHGLPNVANSMAAIKRLVFEEKQISSRELEDILKDNFEDQGGREIRQMLLSAPKFGNDDDYVDLIARDLAELFVSSLKACGTPWRGGSYGASLQGLTANVPEGEMTGATADGREACSPLADNVSPHAGTDLNGVTAMLKSVGKIDHTLFLNGTILNVKLHPSALKAEGIRKLAALIQTYLLDFRGFQMQFNIVSAGQLREAQEHPEEYRSLIVKVAGYSAQFISLDEKLQKQIILRTENVF